MRQVLPFHIQFLKRPPGICSYVSGSICHVAVIVWDRYKSSTAGPALWTSHIQASLPPDVGHLGKQLVVFLGICW